MIELLYYKKKIEKILLVGPTPLWKYINTYLITKKDSLPTTTINNKREQIFICL